MKPFHFPLDRALQWRRTQLEVEEFKLKQMTGELLQLHAAQAEIEAARSGAARQVLGTSALDGKDLGMLDAFLLRSKREEKEISSRRRDLKQRAAERNERLLEARRRVRLMERFRDRRLAAWTAELNREVETLASEAYLAKWNANKRRKPSSRGPRARRASGNAG